jgi:Zn-dependent peptidase ImmA (M78 family)
LYFLFFFFCAFFCLFFFFCALFCFLVHKKFSKKFVFLLNMQIIRKIKSKTVNRRRTDNTMHKRKKMYLIKNDRGDEVELLVYHKENHSILHRYLMLFFFYHTCI